jgi:PAP2 superfamily
LSVSIPLLIGWLVVSRLFRVFFITRSRHPIMALVNDTISVLADGRIMSNGLPMIAAMIPFIYAYSAFKNNIPVLTTFAWDRSLAAADAALHFGVQPWRWLDPLLGSPAAVAVLNFNYALWFFVMWGLWLYLGFNPQRSETRARFFLTFMIIWSIGGTLLAYLFSSAGPCFYGKFGFHPDPYADLLARLRGFNEIVPVFALNVQDMLWESYLGKGSIEGISAMPSMHNGTALLFALAGFSINRWLGLALALHAALIFAGSVYLGWHYAIDAYAAWALTSLAWILSGRVWRWLETTPAVKEHQAALAA